MNMKPTSDAAGPDDADRRRDADANRPIRKRQTGIPGFDEITEGGLPAGRITTVAGKPGAGKTVFALQALVNGLKRHERGIFVAFEEPHDQIRHNVASFDWDFAAIGDEDIRVIDARLPMDAVHSGMFDLSGLLAGLTALIAESGACNVAFDGIDVLLSSLNDAALERQEMIRLNHWVRDSGVMAVVTVKSHGVSERDQQRASLLQYITDCVIDLEGCLSETAFSRTIRITKYRGSGFAANPVPVVIGVSGLEVVGFRSARLNHPTFTERVSTGIPRLDTKLDGGYIRGSCTLVSGAPGTSKTSIGASLVVAACNAGHKALLVSFDESAAQITGNMTSIGLDLGVHVRSGLLVMESLFSRSRSPEEHFVAIRKLLLQHQPAFLVVDPLSALMKMKLPFSEMVCERILDQAKSAGITVLCTSLLDNVSGADELTISHVSAVADTWIHVSYVANQGERNRALTIIKSRGTAHSNQVCELILGPHGIEIVDIYSAEGEVLMGSARHQKQALDRREQIQEEMADQRKRFEIDKSIAELQSRVANAAENLAWKQREAKLLGLDEMAIREGAKADADERLTFRST